ncbi:MAG: peptidase [Solirubrobacterales bacterium]|nr:peptidase [Solirubrobacterales bacterium]
MGSVVYIPLLCALALAAGAPAIARSAPPRQGSAMLVAAAFGAALAADVALVILVGARLIDAAPLATVLGWPPEANGPHPVPLPVSLAAAAGLIVVAIVGQIDWRRSSAAARRVRALHGHADTGELVVLRSPTVLALTLPATRTSPGRILVSDGMLRALDAAERRVLLAHERSHLRHRHDRYRRLVGIAASLNPLLRPTVAAVDFLLERWADEDAADAVGSRHLTARALARAAVADGPRRERLWQPSFAAQKVSRRVNALLAPAPARGARLAMLLAAMTGVIAAATAVAAAHDLGHLFDLLRGDG